MPPIAIMPWSTINAGQNTHAAAQTNPMNAGEALSGRELFWLLRESASYHFEFARAADAADTNNS